MDDPQIREMLIELLLEIDYDIYKDIIVFEDPGGLYSILEEIVQKHVRQKGNE